MVLVQPKVLADGRLNEGLSIIVCWANVVPLYCYLFDQYRSLTLGQCRTLTLTIYVHIHVTILVFLYMDHYLVQRLQVVDPDCIFNLMDQFCNWMWLYQHRPNTWQNCYFDQWPPMLQQLGLDVFHWPKLYWTTWSSNYNIKIKTNLLKKKRISIPISY